MDFAVFGGFVWHIVGTESLSEIFVKKVLIFGNNGMLYIIP